MAMEPGGAVAGLSALFFKLMGAASGSFLALVLIPPSTIKEAISRSTVSLLSGMIFSPLAMDYFSWGATLEHTVAASTLAAMVSWWGLGAIIKITRARIASRTTDKSEELK